MAALSVPPLDTVPPPTAFRIVRIGGADYYVPIVGTTNQRASKL